MQKHVDRASVVTAISQYTADIVKQNVDLKGKEIRVIYNGVERIDHIEGSKPAFATGRSFFFTIGQIRRKKNFHLLLDVMKEFPEYDLYICGDTSCNHGVYAEELRSLIDSKTLPTYFYPALSHRMKKCGSIETVRRCYFQVKGKDSAFRPLRQCNSGKRYLPQHVHLCRRYVEGMVFSGRNSPPKNGRQHQEISSGIL